MELTSFISCETMPLELGGTVVLVGGNISNFKYFGTAAYSRIDQGEMH